MTKKKLKKGGKKLIGIEEDICEFVENSKNLNRGQRSYERWTHKFYGQKLVVFFYLVLTPGFDKIKLVETRLPMLQTQIRLFSVFEQIQARFLVFR